MPPKAGGVKKGVTDLSLTTSYDDSESPFKAVPSAVSDSIFQITNSANAKETYFSNKEDPRWSDSRCMCVAGPLPQHIRNLIMSKDIEAISLVLIDYQEALNSASTDDAVKLYTEDGVCMPQHAQSFVGIANVRKAYDGFFSMIRFNVKFTVEEVVPVAPDWAFARINSAGSTDVKGRGVRSEANQELFVFQKVGGEWKIARYCFSTTSPPPK